MATFAIGDIHGNLAALQDLLGQIHGEVSKDDVVVFLGDYIDRGDDSRGCIDAVLSFRDEGKARVFCLKGNHEDWLLRTRADYRRHSWLIAMEAFPTIRSYSAEAEHTLREALSQAGADAYMDHCPLPYEVFFDALPQTHHAFLSELTLSYGHHGPAMRLFRRIADPAITLRAFESPARSFRSASCTVPRARQCKGFSCWDPRTRHFAGRRRQG
jgi:hypothetical protein